MRMTIMILLCFITVSLFGGQQVGFSVLNLSHILNHAGSCSGTSIYLRDGRNFCVVDDFLSISKHIEACSSELL